MATPHSQNMNGLSSPSPTAKMETYNISSGDDNDKVEGEKVKRAKTQKGQRKRPKLTSKCWQHFDEFYDEEGLRKARCKYCKSELSGESSNETTSLNKHVATCKENPTNSKKDQPKLSLNKNEDGQGIELYARRHSNFRSDLAKVPGYSDWLVAKSLAKLLEVFKTKTVEVSCSTYAVSHRVYAEINDIRESLIELEKENNDLIDFKTMVSSMQAKYDKYFEDDHKTNKLFEFASVLDPRYKLEILQFAGVDVEDVKVEMQLLYKEYECLFATPSNKEESTKDVPPKQPRTTKNSWMDKLERSRSGGAIPFTQITELEKYIADGVEKISSESNFDILLWWKVNSGRYPILSQMAKGRKHINEEEDLVKYDEFAKDVFDKIGSLGNDEV
ncbi:hypothetical protein E3N88_21965 [Mikania micrantha]|uniref:BED-type domain-containing protein n=1 Tax=Mikania micrantha TaxID=192012 RepID=A0A5N6N9F1_9ASTR|nr:hypothetical protein E3N88_21965 [Mikania micrantha]